MSRETQLIMKERKQASFVPRDMTLLLMGGRDKIGRLEELRQIFTSDPVFLKKDRIFLNHGESYLHSLQKMSHFHRKV